jgi:hypothetical protein
MRSHIHPVPSRPAARPARLARALATASMMLALAAAASPARAEGVVARFDKDPLAAGASPAFTSEGDTASRFTFVPGTRPHFPGDRRGSLRVLYDTTLDTGRIGVPLGSVLSFDDDVRFGAVMTIHSAGFAADPNGFSQIAFGLWNSHTTGLGRTLFPSDAFDLVEFDWFANVTSFGGPFLSPSIFGGNLDGNAFDNFTFTSAETPLPFDVPLLCEGVYDAATRRLTVTVSRRLRGVQFEPIPGAQVTVDLSTLHPGYLVDTLGIAAYGEGWASLHAEVDYDLLWVGPRPAPLNLATSVPRTSETRIPVATP